MANNIDSLSIPSGSIAASPGFEEEVAYETALVREVFDEGISNVLALTSRVEKHPLPKNVSKELASNLKVAKKMVEYVRENIPFSGNSLRSPSGFSSPAQYILYNKIILDVIKSQQSSKFKIEYSKKLKIGNCAEMSRIGRDFIKGLSPSLNVELCLIKNGDHTFLLIGRNPNIPLSDFLKDFSLDPDVVVGDPWTQSFYPASKIPAHLKNFLTLNKDGIGRYYTEIESVVLRDNFLYTQSDAQNLSENQLKQLSKNLHFLEACSNGDKELVSRLFSENEISDTDFFLGILLGLKNKQEDLIETLLSKKGINGDLLNTLESINEDLVLENIRDPLLQKIIYRDAGKDISKLQAASIDNEKIAILKSLTRKNFFWVFMPEILEVISKEDKQDVKQAMLSILLAGMNLEEADLENLIPVLDVFNSINPCELKSNFFQAICSAEVFKELPEKVSREILSYLEKHPVNKKISLR